MIEVDQILSAQALPLVLAASTLYIAYVAVYRLYFSPVAAFPGPKLAALSDWYEFYYDVYPNKGQYTFKIAKLHEQYGSIIRITPWELHISTPDFYDTLYSTNQKRDKWDRTVRTFSNGGDGFATVDHNLHRIRRGAVGPYFSTANIRRLQPVLNEKVGIYLERLRGLAKTGQVLRLVTTTSAYSTDVIMDYCFGRSYKRLEADDFGAVAYDRNHEMVSSIWGLKHFNFIVRFMKSLPDSVVLKFGGAVADMIKVNREMREQVIETVNEKDQEQKGLAHRTIFHELLSSDLPPREKSVKRLADDAQVIVNAAGETIAWTLTVITYHLLANPGILKKLKLELKGAIPDLEVGIGQAALENLPYLRAVIKEGLRLSYGVSSRLQRVPHEPLIFKSIDREWIIPAGTPVGMTSVLIHHDESIFPNSHTYNPDRWIEDPRLERYLVAFSKGSRQCLGMNLAYTEMFLWLSNVFGRFGSREVRFAGDEGILELVDTDITDVELAIDYFVPEVRAESQGVQIRVSL